MQDCSLGAPTLAFELRPALDRYGPEPFNAVCTELARKMGRSSESSKLSLLTRLYNQLLFNVVFNSLFTIFIRFPTCLMQGAVFLLTRSLTSMFALISQWKPLRGRFEQKTTPSTIVIQLVQVLNSLLMKLISTFLIPLFIRLRQCLMRDIFSPLITILIEMPTLIGHWKHLLSNHGDSHQQNTELAQRSSIFVPIGYNSNSTAHFASCKHQNSSDLRDEPDFVRKESTCLAKSSLLVPLSPRKRVNRVRPGRLTSGFIPSLESIGEADEEAEDDPELVVSEEKEKRKKNKGEGEKTGTKGDEDKGVHANELETCERGEKEIAKAAWNNEGRNQSVVLMAFPIQNITVEPANVGPSWGGHRRHRIRRRLQRLWIRFITCGTHDVDEYSL